MADPVPGTTPRQTGSATGLATKLATAPLSPFLKVVNSLMQKYPGEYSAHPPEGKDRVDRFFGMNTSLIDQPGGTKIQTPLIHPQTGFIHTGLGLQPIGGSTAGGALIAPGLKPGPGITRDQFITHLKRVIKVPGAPGGGPTQAQQDLLDAIFHTSDATDSAVAQQGRRPPAPRRPIVLARGDITGKNPYMGYYMTPETSALVRALGGPLTHYGQTPDVDSHSVQGAMNPLTGMLSTRRPAWVEAARAGLFRGTGYKTFETPFGPNAPPISPDRLKALMRILATSAIKRRN